MYPILKPLPSSLPVPSLWEILFLSLLSSELHSNSSIIIPRSTEGSERVNVPSKVRHQVSGDLGLESSLWIPYPEQLFSRLHHYLLLRKGLQIQSKLDVGTSPCITAWSICVLDWQPPPTVTTWPQLSGNCSPCLFPCGYGSHVFIIAYTHFTSQLIGPQWTPDPGGARVPPLGI